MFPVECVARGYLTGSGLAEYLATGAVCGVPLPAGLVDGSRLPEPIFTPATKAAHGRARRERDVRAGGRAPSAPTSPRRAARHHPRRLRAGPATSPRERGIVLADTKLELGRDADGRLVLADEVLTPDSSRFWPADQWEPGHAAAVVRQAVRPRLADLAGLRLGPRTPASSRRRCPDDVVERTRAKYVEAYERLTGRTFV